ncbi:sodium-coupled monocarboxylate transporter 1-like isoform X2 [Ruditapes philippinarum]|uniref:sodium-coupled monocarboxylate transporter 1-like isoform X2 n=1 Tax=Ruditapes philippinarum TaxID=129788 RepID=UPI00295A9E55|nr:sodium-coupled monocarboxylate transporter 1-like isoform X2 [Ruditapes philippinarum]
MASCRYGYNRSRCCTYFHPCILQPRSNKCFSVCGNEIWPRYQDNCKRRLYHLDDVLHGYCALWTISGLKCGNWFIVMGISSGSQFSLYLLHSSGWHESSTLGRHVSSVGYVCRPFCTFDRRFDPDPRVRHSVWNLVIGGGIFWCAVYGTNQAQVQRALSVRNVSRSKIAIWLNVIGYDTILLLCCLVGVVMYAFYSECDPVKSGLVDKPDQLVPLWMMDLLSEYPGLPGLFLSTIFSGSLSSVSSGLNAIAAVMLEDFIKPTCCKNISDSTATWLSKGFVVVFGGLSIAFAFVVSNFGTLILTLANVLFGALGGPMLGMFCLGMLFPWSNKLGGCIGLVCGLIMNIWISFGTAITKTSVNIKSPISVDGCIWKYSNTTTLTTSSTTTSMAPSSVETVSTTHIFDKYEGINRLYTVSYMWYSGIGVCTVVVVGMVVSLITGITDTSKLNPKLICPIFDVFFPFLPEKWRKPLRFGVRHGEKDFDEFDDTEKRKELVKKFEGVDEIRPYKNKEKNNTYERENDGYGSYHSSTNL